MKDHTIKKMYKAVAIGLLANIHFGKLTCLPPVT